MLKSLRVTEVIVKLMSVLEGGGVEVSCQLARLLGAVSVHKITVKISYIVDCVYSIKFITTAVYWPYDTISDIVHCVYYVEFHDYIGVIILHIISLTGALGRGKFCIYYSGSETPEIGSPTGALGRRKFCIYYSGSEIPEIGSSTGALRQRKFCIYYSGSETPKIVSPTGENFVYTTVVQKPPKSYLRQVHYVGENFVFTTAV